jgi:hypothetical protein
MKQPSDRRRGKIRATDKEGRKMNLCKYNNPQGAGWFGWIESDNLAAEGEVLGFVALHGAIIWKWELGQRKGSRPDPPDPAKQARLAEELGEHSYATLELQRDATIGAAVSQRWRELADIPSETMKAEAHAELENLTRILKSVGALNASE